MEKALLQEMIRDREITIRFLEKKVEGRDERAKQLRAQHETTEASKQTKRDEQRAELMKLWKDYDGMLCRYQNAKDALDSKKYLQQRPQSRNGNGAEGPIGSDLAVYHDIMKDVVVAADGETGAGGGADHSSSYVVRMQSQLCKAMHGMGIMETQRQMTKGQMDQIQKKARDVLPEMIEEKSHVELKMVNELIFADVSKREVESKRNLQHEKFSKEQNDLMEKIERQIDEATHSNETEDGDHAENDAEEEEAKEELQAILQEGKEEMVRLEKLIHDKEAKVEELKISAAMAQGQDVVDDIVTTIAEEFAEDESGDEGSEDESY